MRPLYPACLRIQDRPAHSDAVGNSREPVVCLDERPVPLHADLRPTRPSCPGHVGKRDNEYWRCGVANIFAVVESKAGRHFTRATANRSAAQFALVIRNIVTAYPFARKIHLVMDNLNIHCRKSLIDRFGTMEGNYLWGRLRVHYTPKHGSWLNQAELELSLVSRQCLGTRRIPNLQLLQSEIQSWNARANRNRVQIDWKFTRKAARVKFGYKTTLFKRSKT